MMEEDQEGKQCMCESVRESGNLVLGSTRLMYKMISLIIVPASKRGEI
jgi:hypothetical protein